MLVISNWEKCGPGRTWAEAGDGCRLKQATVMRQEDEEDGLRWRVEAEVRLAVDRAQQAAAQQEAQMHKDMADMQVTIRSLTATDKRVLRSSCA